MSLYSQYLKEREGVETLEDANGFASYKYLEDCVYVTDVYVVPEMRKKGIASDYVDRVSEIAKDKGYSKVVVSVDLRANGASESMMVQLRYGFKLDSCNENMIYLIKEI